MALNPAAFDVTHQWNWELRPLGLHGKSVAKAEPGREGAWGLQTWISLVLPGIQVVLGELKASNMESSFNHAE